MRNFSQWILMMHRLNMGAYRTNVMNGRETLLAHYAINTASYVDIADR